MLPKLSKTKLVNWELWLAAFQLRKSQLHLVFTLIVWMMSHPMFRNIHWEIIMGCGRRISVSIYNGQNWKQPSRLIKRRVPRSPSTTSRVGLCNRGFQNGVRPRDRSRQVSDRHSSSGHTSSIFTSFECYSS